jgi:16S rRNA (cytosine967-C5)-methyltransferase
MIMTVETAEHSLYEGVRGTAVKILNRVERTDSYLDKLLDHEFHSDDINDLDKGLLNEIVHGVLRWQLKLDWVITGFFHGNYPKSDVNVRNALRVALYQILFLERVPPFAAVNEAVEMIKRVRGQKSADLVNGVLRNITRNVAGIRYPAPSEDPIHYLSIVYSHPQWIVRRWVERYGIGETEKLLAANNERPMLTLRVNTLRSTIDEILAALDAARIQYTRSPYLDAFVRVSGLGNVGSNQAFREGKFSIQDESAGLVCQLVSPQSGDRIIDLCAAPGGKSTCMAELMHDKGEIIAIDKFDVKMRMIKSTIDRLGISIITTEAADAATYDGDPADKVLLDAPCSGLGVLMKKPDIKWKREPEDITALAATQDKLLRNAARLVKPGGVLVYSTCTMEPEENIDRIRLFCNIHPEFTVDDAKQYVPGAIVNSAGWIETLPSTHGVDGSFAVRLVRNQSGKTL